LARSIHELAELHLAMDKLDVAEKTGVEALQMRERLFGTQRQSLRSIELDAGSEHQDVAKSLHLMALVRLKRVCARRQRFFLLSLQGDVAGSEAIAERSLTILRSVFGERHVKVASVLCHFAHLRSAQKKYPEGTSLTSCHVRAAICQSSHACALEC
jgi:hypothetical protein